MQFDYAICGTRNADVGLPAGLKILREGGSALDAVEESIKLIENNPYDITVGFNGFPNLLGTVELDASIMDGKTRQAGSIAAVRNFRHPISIARKVMEISPHVMLVGEGAEKFARALGFIEEDIIDELGIKNYHNIIEGKSLEMPQEAQTLVRELFMRFDDHLKEVMEKYAVKDWYRKLSFDKHGTTNVIALDKHNNLAVGVSTSGLAMKFPGRVGDSPLFGAGIYCSETVGAACTGTGELAIRLSTARLVVDRYERKLPLDESTRSGITDLMKIKEEGVLHILSMNNKGDCSAFTNKDGIFHFYADSNMEEPVKRLSNYINLKKK
ncbi:MAG: isoaspartyl peptidase [Candidatus Heimdallarchaeota archaeon]|nr:isoaspartyl peptidase [Candidatus Heimdallarchaeota archaeon]